jgi:protein-S-isoprenylcysteine O-methyltransferase Ste14
MPGSLFEWVLTTWIVAAVAVFPLLLRVKAPYGRYVDPSWGPTIPSRLGWILMELPAVLVFGFFFLAGDQSRTWVTWSFFVAWEFHYVYRSLVYPFRQRASGKRMPVLVALFAVVFNLGNGYANGHYLGAMVMYESNWASDPRFVVGLVLFVAGLVINWRSDGTLRRLRRPGDEGYRIPRGGLFEKVSCPNYLGELIEWSGFAVMTWSPAAAVFVIWTAANLVPRAMSHHRWYRETFPDYPSERKALVPHVI